MNEWQLQHELSQKFRKEKYLFEGSEFDLVLWELMFPSWKINDNRKKWDEPSLDFIFYSEAKNEFLCLELKNVIQGNKNLLSAYYQTTHRTILFIEQYSSTKISKARKECFNYSISKRGGVTKKPRRIQFSNNPIFKRILMAYSFPKNSKKQIEFWNDCNLAELKLQSKEYSANKEINRFMKLTEKQFFILEQPLSLVHLTESTFNT